MLNKIMTLPTLYDVQILQSRVCRNKAILVSKVALLQRLDYKVVCHERWCDAEGEGESVPPPRPTSLPG